jgi:polygalacturonase
MEKMRRLFLIVVLLAVYTVARAYGSYHVMDFGAKGDGINLDSNPINEAIATASRNGGGKVEIPAGRYLCGSIRLKSNIELHLDAGAVIVASSDPRAYDKSEPFDFPEYQDGGHTYFHNSLIWADGEQNIAVTGQGMIDGRGLTKKDTEDNGRVLGGSIGMGDKSIALKLCKNILIRDISIYHGGHFAIIATGCDRGNIDDVTIDTNRDGIDVDCCRFFTIENCKINSPNDDGIVLKASYALKKSVTCEHILINNCIVSGYQLGTFLNGSYVPGNVGWGCGRIKLGTESNGGFRNITVSNCTLMYSSGIAFEEVDQGRMENIVVSNISMNHIWHYPIYITTGSRNRGPQGFDYVSEGQDIMISNVIIQDCDSLCGIIVTGMKGHPLRNITLKDIQIEYRGGGDPSLGTLTYPELGTNYPEPRLAGPTPSYGLYARHVDGLVVKDVVFSTQKTDYRPCVILNDVVHETIDVRGGWPEAYRLF